LRGFRALNIVALRNVAQKDEHCQEGNFRSGTQSDFSQFGDASHFDPFDNENVAGVIETGAVGSDEFAGSKVIARVGAGLAPLGWRVIAEVGDDLIFLSEQGDARAEVGQYDIAVAKEAEMARQIGPGDEIDVAAVECEA